MDVSSWCVVLTMDMILDFARQAPILFFGKPKQLLMLVEGA